MGSVKRYDMITVTRCGEGWQELQREDLGEWVSYDDYLALLQVAEQRLNLLREIVVNTDSGYDALASHAIDKARVALAAASRVMNKENVNG